MENNLKFLYEIHKNWQSEEYNDLCFFIEDPKDENQVFYVILDKIENNKRNISSDLRILNDYKVSKDRFLELIDILSRKGYKYFKGN